MIQKVIKVGNSLAVTIPTSEIKEKNLHVGDSLEVSFNSVFSADKEIHKLTQDLIKEYRPALEELASR